MQFSTKVRHAQLFEPAALYIYLHDFSLLQLESSNFHGSVAWLAYLAFTQATRVQIPAVELLSSLLTFTTCCYLLTTRATCCYLLTTRAEPAEHFNTCIGWG